MSTPPSNQQRTTFRPPWVKETPNPLPVPTAPWTPRARNLADTSSESRNINQQQQQQHQEKKHTLASSPLVLPLSRSSQHNVSSEKTNAAQLPPVSNVKNKMSIQLPPPPPPPPVPPPAPPAPSITNNQAESLASRPLTKEKLSKLEALRSRPRRRPDWSDMMKEVESGKKLKHVQCNDRSAPVLPEMKAKGQFVYESEKKEEGNSHNKLLKQIQTGVRLKKVRCNDRSKPNLDGLRKFRRQMTIEEQIQKSVSMADVVAAAVEPDELDDIDKVRDDLQSAKQMLALELRNKEAIERENKRLMARLANLEAELEKEKSLRKTELVMGQQSRTHEDEKLISKLKAEASDADHIAKEMEQKYHATAEQLDNIRRKLESAWLVNQELEQQLKSLSQGTPTRHQLMKQPSKKFIPIANGSSVDLISDDEGEGDSDLESEDDTETENENANDEIHKKQLAKELKLLTTKLRTFREKQCTSLKERRILKEQLKKKQKELKEEKSKFKLLQKEVDKMARLMKETDDEEDCSEEEEESESEEESDDSERESEESEEEPDQELPSGASSVEERKTCLLALTKKHENRLSSLKKGNNLLKANIERLQDDINKQRDMSLMMQEDLNNVLADLG